jgi:hypothetical protein
MGIAAFKDLCLDAADAEVVGGFWASALGLALEVRDDGDTAIHGEPLHHLWVDNVPEPKAVKNRVHLDVYSRSADPLIDRGATVLADHGRWQVLADPEGNELCLFPDAASGSAAAAGPAAPMRPFALCVDSADPLPLAAWWADVLGGTLGDGPGSNPRWLHGAAGMPGLVMKFVPVEDERVVKNRCHWDVTTDDVGLLVAAGATVLRPRDDEIGWTVMADPQGNEFCAFAPS